MDIAMGDIAPLMEGARKIVVDCARVTPNEKVLIITDTGRDLAVAYALMEAAMDVGSEVAVITMKERDAPGLEPPPQVNKAMLESDVILQVTSTIMGYSQAKKDACKKGARFAAMTGMIPDILMSPALTETDFKKLKPFVEKMSDMVTAAKKATVTTHRGTALTMNLEGRGAELCTAILETPGKLSGMPDLEVYIAPVENSVNGTAVIDATISSSGLVTSPVTLTIKDGIVQKIEGGKDAEVLRTLLENQRNPHVYQVAELGIGLNPNACLRGAIIEDEGVLGTAHVAVGDNTLMNGLNKAPIHVDMVMKDPTIELDGRVVISAEGKTIHFASELFPLTEPLKSSGWDTHKIQ
ncbi:MAG: aminopeptidase [Theionarchaea archaeon]|nr:aminopeptidase [Theionarchaea archaeon]MBU7037173.1 aminopeptidase [Theionarchaea archaeon]